MIMSIFLVIHIYIYVRFLSPPTKGTHNIFFDEAPGKNVKLGSRIQLAFFFAKVCETNSFDIPFFLPSS